MSAIDPDIATAASIMDLEKIKVQDWRNDAKQRLLLDERKQADWKASDAARRAAEDAQRAAAEEQRQIINAGDERRTRALEEETQTRKVVAADFYKQDINELIIALAPNYMKPSTATTSDGRGTDVERDGEFLRAAVLKVLAVRRDVITQQVALMDAGA